MTRVDVVKKEIEQLAPAEREEIARWMDEQTDAKWDNQIRRDHAAGKLDALINAARKEAATGKLRDIPS